MKEQRNERNVSLTQILASHHNQTASLAAFLKDLLSVIKIQCIHRWIIYITILLFPESTELNKNLPAAWQALLSRLCIIIRDMSARVTIHKLEELASVRCQGSILLLKFYTSVFEKILNRFLPEDKLEGRR